MQQTYVFPPPEQTSIPVVGCESLFPVHRIYCVGKNYAAHVIEMGADPKRQPPCFFMKPADAIVTSGEVSYPPKTDNYHYEGELVMAIGKGGCNISPHQALDHVFGYAVGLDMTRRDLQSLSVRAAQPWDTGKGFDQSAPISPVVPVAICGHPDKGSIQTHVNGILKQDADLTELIWKNHEIVAQLSTFFELLPGDLIYTGTPAGVGAVIAGDSVRVCVEGVGELAVNII